MEKVYGLPRMWDESHQTANPCKVQGLTVPSANPDPFVLRFNGMYYSYSTGYEGVRVMTSPDLVVWEKREPVLCGQGQQEFWAPSVIYRNGVFYMYYSSTSEDGFEFMRVATAKHPLGPFQYQKTLLACFAIDTHAVRGEDGEYYLFYCTDRYCGNRLFRPGTSVQVDRLVDMFTLEGNPKSILTPTIDQEISGREFAGAGIDWHTVEGPFYLRRRQRDYLMYSGNAFGGEDYFIGYARSAPETADSPMTEKRWTKFPDNDTYCPFSRKNSRVEGTGHNSVVKAPNLLDDWCVYHGRLVGYRDQEDSRMMFTDRILWDGDEMWFSGPTWKPQDAPASPAWYDRFENGLGRWKTVGGEWDAENGAAVQRTGEPEASMIRAERYENYLFECWCKSWFQGHGAYYGIYAWYEDNKNYAALLLREGSKKAEAVICRNGAERVAAEYGLENDFNFFALHALRCVKNGTHLHLYVDDIHVAEISCPEGSAGAVGMLTRLCGAAFSAATLTNCRSSQDAPLEEWIRCDAEEGRFEASEEGLCYQVNRADVWGQFTYTGTLGDRYEAEMDLLPAVREIFRMDLKISEDVTLELTVKRDSVTVNGRKINEPGSRRCSFHILRNGGHCAVLFRRVCIWEGQPQAEPCLKIRVSGSAMLEYLSIIE